MLRKILVATLGATIASTCSAFPFALSLDGIPATTLPEPIFFKGVTTSRGGVSQTYIGLADRMLSINVNEQREAAPPVSYAPVMSFSVTERPGAIYMKDTVAMASQVDGTVRVIDRQGQPLTMNERFNSISLPREACGPGALNFKHGTCQWVRLGGALIDQERGEYLANVRFESIQEFVTLELKHGPEAIAAFQAARAGLARQLQARRDAVVAQNKARTAWRAQIKEGAMTSCGLVIERKKEIAHIQFNQGTRWIRIDQLAQPGESAVCQ